MQISFEVTLDGNASVFYKGHLLCIFKGSVSVYLADSCICNQDRNLCIVPCIADCRAPDRCYFYIRWYPNCIWDRSLRWCICIGTTLEDLGTTTSMMYNSLRRTTTLPYPRTRLCSSRIIVQSILMLDLFVLFYGCWLFTREKCRMNISFVYLSGTDIGIPDRCCNRLGTMHYFCMDCLVCKCSSADYIVVLMNEKGFNVLSEFSQHSTW